MMRRSHCRAALPAQTLPAALGVLMIALGFASSAGAQSFDCRNARYADEKAICQDGRLGDLDKQLADTYDRAGNKLSKQERQQFEDNETAFVNARHRCGGNQACIEQSYRNRMQELLSVLPEDQSGRSERRSDANASDRQKTSRDTGKTEEVRTGPDETKREGAESPPLPVERSLGQSETKPAVSSSPAETRSSREEPVKAGSAVPNPPSRHEAEAALAATPPPEKHSRHKRHTESVAVAPPAPVREEPPAASAPAVPERHSSKSGNSASSEKSGSAAASERHPAAASERHPAAAPNAPIPEKQPATGSSTAAAEPANPPEKKHSRVKHITASTPAAAPSSGTSAPSPAPADQAKPEAKPEIKWVNPSPSR